MKLPIRDVKPNPKNPRVIKDENFKKLVNSIKEFPEMTEQTGRTCYMMELDPKYCDVIRKRYDNFVKDKTV